MFLYKKEFVGKGFFTVLLGLMFFFIGTLPTLATNYNPSPFSLFSGIGDNPPTQKFNDQIFLLLKTTDTLNGKRLLTDPTISRDVGAYSKTGFFANTNKVAYIVVKDATGKKVEVVLGDDRSINAILDSSGNLFFSSIFGYDGSNSGVNIDSDAGKALLDKMQVTDGYQGNTYQDIKNQDIIFALKQSEKVINSRSTLTAARKAEDIALLEQQINYLNNPTTGTKLTSQQMVQIVKDGGMSPNGFTDNVLKVLYYIPGFQSALQLAAGIPGAQTAAQILSFGEIDRLGAGIAETSNIPFVSSGVPGGKDSTAGLGSAYLVKNQTEAIVNNTSGDTTSGACIIWDRGKYYVFPEQGATLGACFAQVFYFILWLASFFVGVSSIIFNAVFDYTVVHIAGFVNMTGSASSAGGGLTIIKVGWTAVRDIANICFIFVLLYLAIATILQLDEHGVKHSLSRLVIAAVLINFSLFFTKIIIDVPNMLSIEIYNKIVSKDGKQTGLADSYLALLKVQGILSDNSPTGINGILQSDKSGQAGISGGPGSQANIINENGLRNSNAKTFAASKSPFTTFAVGIVLEFFIIVVFVAVSIIFIKRFVVLLFLMIFSPLAFVGMAVPISSLQGAAKEKFWNTLIKESFYAPIFMLCVYISLQAGKAIVNTPGQEAVPFSSIIDTQQIFGFAVIIVMLFASLIIAEIMGVRGAAGAMGFYNRAKSMATGALIRGGGGATGWGLRWAWRQTGGRALQTIINKTSEEGGIGMSDKIAKWTTGADKRGNEIKGWGGAKGWLVKKAARGFTRIARAGGKGFEEKEIGADVAALKQRIEEAHGNEEEIAKAYLMANGKGVSSTLVQAIDVNHREQSEKSHAGISLNMQKLIRNEYKRQDGESEKKWAKRVGVTRDAADTDETFERKALEAHGQRQGMARTQVDDGAGGLRLENDEEYAKRVGDRAIKDNWSYERYYGEHGRVEEPSKAEVERLRKGALPFHDKEFRDVLTREVKRSEIPIVRRRDTAMGETVATWETRLQGLGIDTARVQVDNGAGGLRAENDVEFEERMTQESLHSIKAAEIEKLAGGFEDHAQLSSALLALTAAQRERFSTKDAQGKDKQGRALAEAKTYKNALTRAVANSHVLKSEALATTIGKATNLGIDIQEAIGNGFYKIMNRVDLHNTFQTEDGKGLNYASTKVIEKYAREMEDFGTPEIKTALTAFKANWATNKAALDDIDVRLEDYIGRLDRAKKAMEKAGKLGDQAAYGVAETEQRMYKTLINQRLNEKNGYLNEVKALDEAYKKTEYSSETNPGSYIHQTNATRVLKKSLETTNSVLELKESVGEMEDKMNKVGEIKPTTIDYKNVS